MAVAPHNRLVSVPIHGVRVHDVTMPRALKELDSFVRDYFIERLEMLLSHRLVNAHYPRLSLAPGQRFASKGGYLVRFADEGGSRLVADSDWIVP